MERAEYESQPSWVSKVRSVTRPWRSVGVSREEDGEGLGAVCSCLPYLRSPYGNEPSDGPTKDRNKRHCSSTHVVSHPFSCVPSSSLAPDPLCRDKTFFHSK